jgi:putative hydrolase of the HAD superfamily
MTKESQIKTIFLDVGGVLLTNGWDRHARARAIEKFDLDDGEVGERHHLTFDTYEEGKLSLDEYLGRVVFYKKRNFILQEFKDFMFAQSKPFEDMIDFIKALKREYNLRAVTVNNEGREINAHRIREFKLYEFIDAFVSSCFVHFRKPDEDIFRVALDISQTPPSDVVYIDDRPMFVEIAESLGIKGVIHEDIETTRKRLEELSLVLGDYKKA